jgi:hypothetical protein
MACHHDREHVTMRNQPLETKGNPGLLAIVEESDRRRRKPNKNRTPAPAGQAFTFLPHEFAILKFNKPGPSGVIGGYQGMENIVITCTNKTTLTCVLAAGHFERLVRYIQKYGDGGPNKRLRNACIPALRRINIDLLPDWRAPV